MLQISSFDIALSGFVLSALIGVWNVISSMKKDTEHSTTVTNRIIAQMEMLDYRVKLLEDSNPRCIKGKDSS